MSERSAFDRQNIEESAVTPEPGLLEQFNLPPDVVTFLRKNQRIIWFIVGSIFLTIVAVALYNQYTEHKEEKAASALATAMQEEGDKKSESLAKVVAEYGSTSSGMWGRIELAHIAAKEGDLAKAIQEFNWMKSEVSKDDPLMPLVLYALGVYHEKNNEPDKAVNAFNELSIFKGFEASSYEAMGRIHEMQGDKAKALDMYRKSLEPGMEGESTLAANPNREIIQAKINSLEE